MVMKLRNQDPVAFFYGEAILSFVPLEGGYVLSSYFDPFTGLCLQLKMTHNSAEDCLVDMASLVGVE